jgi:hypothetical protein
MLYPVYKCEDYWMDQGQLTIYRVGYKDDDIDDEFDVIKLDNNGKVTWRVESLLYGDILNSSKVGKKLINYCIKNG